eukprot:1151031-Pelagomonas_calceolata.AAC.9
MYHDDMYESVCLVGERPHANNDPKESLSYGMCAFGSILSCLVTNNTPNHALMPFCLTQKGLRFRCMSLEGLSCHVDARVKKEVQQLCHNGIAQFQLRWDI